MTMDVLAMTGTLPAGLVGKKVPGVSPPFTSGPGGLPLGSAVITDMDNLHYTITVSCSPLPHPHVKPTRLSIYQTALRFV